MLTSLVIDCCPVLLLEATSGLFPTLPVMPFIWLNIVATFMPLDPTLALLLGLLKVACSDAFSSAKVGPDVSMTEVLGTGTAGWDSACGKPAAPR